MGLIAENRKQGLQQIRFSAPARPGYYFDKSILSGINQLIQIDVSFYLHCTTNLWHMCQFFSAKIRLIIEYVKCLG